MPISRSQIEKHLKIIAKPRDPFQNLVNLHMVQRYIEDELKQYGYYVTPQPFSFQGHSFQNILASRSSSKEFESPPMIIGAHFDAVPGTDGADDNASGVVALLESARVLADEKINLPVQFIAFNLEEYGMLGSKAYVEHLKRDKIKIAGMLSLEMVGYADPRKGSQKLPLVLKPFYPDTGNFIALVGDSQSTQLLKKVAAAFKTVQGLPVESLNVPGKGMLLPEVRLSDHSPFWDAGYPALLVTDTSFFRNPHYHFPEDKIETLNLDFLEKVTEGVIQWVLQTK